MTKDFIKRYMITLETEGPLFIGSGKELTKKEWIYDRKKKKGIILDERKLFDYLSQKKLIDSFESFMLDSRSRTQLYDWMTEHGVYHSDAGKIKKYEADCRGLQNVKRDVAIQLFIKDGYGYPYIPGSSLKGALRNVILAEMIRKNPCDNSSIVKNASNPKGQNRKQFMRRESVSLNQTYFNKRKLTGKKSDMVNDIMSGIRISDSDPLDVSCLTICQKVDTLIDGGDNSLNIVRECIRPGTKIKMQMNVDTTCLKVSPEYIQRAVNNFLKEYNDLFLSHFREEKQYRSDIIYLGGGTGYHTKTVTNRILADRKDRTQLTSQIIDSTLNRKIQREHKHSRDKTLGVSPHTVKCTEYDGYLQQMGPCRISIDEL